MVTCSVGNPAGRGNELSGTERTRFLPRLKPWVSALGYLMTKEPIEVLDDLADQVADEFEAYRQPDEFKDVSLVIEISDKERPTLIVHVDREDAESLADVLMRSSAITVLVLNGNDTQLRTSVC